MSSLFTCIDIVDDGWLAGCLMDAQVLISNFGLQSAPPQQVSFIEIKTIYVHSVIMKYVNLIVFELRA